jgi:biotin carboxyl carrier protein
MKKLRITVEGKTYEVTVEEFDTGGQPTAPAPTSAPVAAASVGSAPAVAPAPASAAAAGGGAGLVASPLAGKVVTISAALGQQVNEGDQLIVLEAMKMNTFINAPQSGKVTEILVQPGDGVEEGQGLIRLG